MLLCGFGLLCLMLQEGRRSSESCWWIEKEEARRMFYTSIYYSQVYLVISGLLSCCTPVLIIQATICIRRGKNYIRPSTLTHASAAHPNSTRTLQGSHGNCFNITVNKINHTPCSYCVLNCYLHTIGIFSSSHFISRSRRGFTIENLNLNIA